MAAAFRNAIMTETPEPNRCRVVLIAPLDESLDSFRPKLAEAVAGGDVASVIIPAREGDDAAFQAFSAAIAPIAQAAGAAVLIAQDTRIAGRIGADGVHLECGRVELEEAIERLAPKLIVGAGGVRTREEALELGEARPDYMFFGKFGLDTKPEPHARNLSLGEWWAEMIQIPCIVMAGSDVESVATVAATGAEFVALSTAVFAAGTDPRAAVARANAILDDVAPRFED